MVFLGGYLLWLEVDYLALGLRILGFLVLFLSMSALGSMNFTDIHNFSSVASSAASSIPASSRCFGVLGSTLVLLCCVATGITLFTGWSWLMIVEKMGECVTGSGHFCHPAGVDWRAGLRAGRLPARRRISFVAEDDLDDEDELPGAPILRGCSGAG